jgi:cytochrome oxidase assembly protein ShyY1
VPGEAELQARLGRGLKPKVEPPQNPLWILWIFPACAFGLGLWQVYRKGVKESFISEKESQLRAPPITLPHK